MSGKEPVACPVSCGQCCDDYWREVVAGDGDSCPYQTDSGCSLPLDSRPDGCATYLCDVGRMVLDGQRSRAWGEAMVAKCLHVVCADGRWSA